MTVAVFALVGVLLLIFRMPKSPLYEEFLVTSLVGYLVFALFMLRRFFFGTMRNLQYAADSRAARIVGRESFIQALSKIDALSLNYRPRFIGRYNFGPNTRQRLEKLKEDTSVPAFDLSRTVDPLIALGAPGVSAQPLVFFLRIFVQLKKHHHDVLQH